MGEMEIIECAGFTGYCCAGKGDTESTTVGELVTINFYHEQLLGASVPIVDR